MDSDQTSTPKVPTQHSSLFARRLDLPKGLNLQPQARNSNEIARFHAESGRTPEGRFGFGLFLMFSYEPGRLLKS